MSNVNKVINSISNGKSDIIENYTFKFPLEKSFSKVEIPFAFQDNFDKNNNGKFHSYIQIRDTPTLYLDMSTEQNIDKLFLSSSIETLRSDNQLKEKRIESMESSISSLQSENENAKNEIKRIKEEIIIRNGKIHQLTEVIKSKEEIYQKKLNELDIKSNEKSALLHKMKENYEKILNSKNKNSNNNSNSNSEKEDTSFDNASEQLAQLNLEYSKSLSFLKNKFSLDTYNDTFIQKNLNLDIIDFQAHVNERIKLVKPKIKELIDLIQNAVNDSIGTEFEVKLFGSHATNLCLPWSDIDVVIDTRDANSNSYPPLHELYKYLLDKNYFNSMNFIGTAAIPLIKIHTKENFNSISVDISAQDKNHYGIKCVAFVNSLIAQYEVLTPLVLVLKNILKQANLNDPYKGGLSSYGLILLIVYFLRMQMEQGKSIKNEEYNLGRLFYEFLFFYGFQFDQSKSIITLTNNKNINFFDNTFYPNQSELIIEDPLNSNNNVGKNTRQYSNIKLAFMIGFLASKESCECGCHYQFTHTIGPRLNVEHCILKRIFNGVRRFTQDTVK